MCAVLFEEKFEILNLASLLLNLSCPLIHYFIRKNFFKIYDEEIKLDLSTMAVIVLAIIAILTAFTVPEQSQNPRTVLHEISQNPTLIVPAAGIQTTISRSTPA